MEAHDTTRASRCFHAKQRAVAAVGCRRIFQKGWKVIPERECGFILWVHLIIGPPCSRTQWVSSVKRRNFNLCRFFSLPTPRSFCPVWRHEYPLVSEGVVPHMRMVAGVKFHSLNQPQRIGDVSLMPLLTFQLCTVIYNVLKWASCTTHVVRGEAK